MIRYTLHCDNGHQFDSWFRSSDAYDSLRKAGQVSCLQCGSTSVDKALMAPAVATAEAKPALKSDLPPELEKLRAEIEANSDYVGMSFASQARAMHEGEIPERAIYGETRPEEARQLIEDGVPVAPLPFIPRRKTN